MKKNKLGLKILALTTALFLIGAILFVTNSFVGNPISAAFAGKAIKNYVAENYGGLDLETEKPVYNFKFGTYMATVKSKTSVDTHFSVSYRKGKVTWDDYEGSVLGKHNTLSRLEKEYSEVVKPILSKIPELKSNNSMVQIEKEEYSTENENIKLDMNFNKALPLDMKINLRADLEDNSLKSIAKILENSHKILVENGCIFTSYDIFSEYKEVLVMITNVTPADIESGELEKLLIDAQNYKDEEEDKVIEKGEDKLQINKRIRVFIKDGKERK